MREIERIICHNFFISFSFFFVCGLFKFMFPLSTEEVEEKGGGEEEQLQ